MNKTTFKLPDKDQLVLAISNGDGSFQLIALSQQQAQLVNIAISSISDPDHPLIVSPIKLIQDESKRTY